MTRNSIYVLLSIILFFTFILPNLLNPNHGWVFIVEELVGLFFLVSGFLVLKSIVNRIVVKLNQQRPWAKNKIQRTFIDLGIVLFFSALCSLLLLFLAWIFFEIYGEPEYFRTIELAVQEEHERRGRSFIVKKFSVIFYAPSIIKGCLFMFFVLFFVEESYENNKGIEEQKLIKEQAAKEQALSRVSALQRQLNPHFIFNTLNVLSGLIQEDLDKADEFIKKLSEIYRYVIVQNEEIVTTVAKELEFANAYIFLLKIRFENQFNISIEVDKNKLDWLLPSLTLELLIENAIKHNSLNTSYPLEIKIFVKDEILVVKNDYRPRLDKEKSSNIGIQNLQERLSILGVKNASFGIHNEKYIASIPLINPHL